MPLILPRDRSRLGTIPSISEVPSVPAAPVIDLLAISDRGASTTDNISNDPEPRFSIDGSFQVGWTVHTYKKESAETGFTESGSGVSLTAGMIAGADPVPFMGTPLTDGVYEIYMTVESPVGESDPSNIEDYTLDTSLGTITASISGNQTSDTTPDLPVDISASNLEVGHELEVRAADGAVLGTLTVSTADVGGTAAVTLSELALGSHTVTVYGYDASGNFTAADEYTFAVAVVPYSAVAVAFDGSADWIDYGDVSASLADSKLVTLSFWMNLASWPGSSDRVFIGLSNGSNIRFALLLNVASGEFRFTGRGSPGTILTSVISNIPVGSWFHFLCSIDMASGIQVYVDDADYTANVATTTFTDAALDFTPTDFEIGSLNGGGAKFACDAADLWIDFGAALDISVEANRRKFISATGKPVDLGATGNLPTGSQVEITHNAVVASWHTNVGSISGGTLTGTLATASTSPSD